MVHKPTSDQQSALKDPLDLISLQAIVILVDTPLKKCL